VRPSDGEAVAVLSAQCPSDGHAARRGERPCRAAWVARGVTSGGSPQLALS